MIVFIKRLRDWKTVGTANVISYDAPVFSNDNSGGSMSVDAGITTEHLGYALLHESGKYAWIIKSVKPEENEIRLGLVDFLNAFDRVIKYTEPASGTGSAAFIAGVLGSEFNNCPDPEYKVKLTAFSDSGTDFTKPELSEGELFNPMDYIRSFVQRGGRMTVNYAPEQLTTTAPRFRFESAPKSYNLPVDDGHTQMISVEVAKNTTAKVTTLIGGTTQNYYLQPDGTVGLSPPSPRIAGLWRMLVPNENENIVQQVKEIFNENTESHQLEFYTDRELEWGGKLRTAYRGEFYDAAISAVSISSADGRYRCKAGDLARTLTEKLASLSKPMQLGKPELTGVLRVAQGGTGQIIRSSGFTLTPYDANVASASGKLELYPYLHICFARIYAKTNRAYSQGYEYTLCTVDSNNAPGYYHALAVWCEGGQADAWIDSSGRVRVYTHSAVNDQSELRITGWWFLNN